MLVVTCSYIIVGTFRHNEDGDMLFYNGVMLLYHSEGMFLDHCKDML